MSSILFWQQIINGMVTGSIYAMLGLGLSQIYGVLGISHFAHGSVMMFGGYVAYTACKILGLNFWFALIVATVVCGFIGVLIEKFFYRKIISGPGINIFIVAMGLVYIFETICQMIWGADQVAIRTNLTQTIMIGGVSVTLLRLTIFTISVLMLCLLYVLMKHTKLGRSIRAVAQNKDAAAIVGVSVNKTYSLVFLIGSALAGMIGVLYSAQYSTYPTLGGSIVLQGFCVTILGGMESIFGIFVGGLLFGMIEVMGGFVIGTEFKDAFGFIAIILVLMLKPEGLFTKKQSA